MTEKAYTLEEAARKLGVTQTGGDTALAVAIREEGRSLRWLAARLGDKPGGIDPMNVSRWAKGQKPVPDKHKAKIARLLNRSKTSLFGRQKRRP